MSFFTSCSKDETPPDSEKIPDDTTPTDEDVFYKLIRLENLPGTQENNGENEAPTVFYSLENDKNIESKYGPTNRWDISFGGLFNSFLSGNNGKNTTNSGFGNTAIGGIKIVEKHFDEVIDIPQDNQFNTGNHLIGTDKAGDFGEGTGWFLYDFEGTIVRNGTEQDKHVAYALSEALTLKNGTTLAPRTIVVRTAKGNYAKIKMISCYKDLYAQELWTKDGPKMYFTFEYVIVPAGSTKFEIK
jgi:hypothetical protein